MRRRTYVILLISIIALGLAIHLHGFGLPGAARDILGDALWASMIFWIASLGAPGSAIVARVVMALAICFAVEFSQHIRHPMLAAIRGTSLGHLVLGSDFDARDLVAYTAGVAVSAVLAWYLLYRAKYLTETRAPPTFPS